MGSGSSVTKNHPTVGQVPSGAVVARDGCVYFMPLDARQFLRLDPTTRTTSLVGDELEGAMKYTSAAIAPNGRIHCCPSTARRVSSALLPGVKPADPHASSM